MRSHWVSGKEIFNLINPLAFLGCAGPGSWANKVNEVTKK